jgi:hypothetical protein
MNETSLSLVTRKALLCIAHAAALCAGVRYIGSAQRTTGILPSVVRAHSIDVVGFFALFVRCSPTPHNALCAPPRTTTGPHGVPATLMRSIWTALTPSTSNDCAVGNARAMRSCPPPERGISAIVTTAASPNGAARPQPG